jgi:riboflavin synthase
MFTGLIEDVGALVSAREIGGGGGRELTIRTALPTTEIAIGDSIACDGVCLTAETLGADTFTVTAGRETLALTTVGGWRAGRRLNLERALQAGARLGGHLVAGHVDGVGAVESVEERGESWVIWIAAPAELGRYIATKGSICLDGVSLTVNELRDSASACAFRINIIPHTAAMTTLAGYRPGRPVNLEVDLVARYLERLLQGGAAAGGGASEGSDEGRGGGGLTLERLRELGYK